MSRLTDLIAKAKAKDPQLGADLEREFRALSSRLSFGLNFERHKPEAVELPNRPIRKGDKVRVLPPRGSTTKGDQRLWKVKAVRKRKNETDLEWFDAEKAETQTVALDDVIVVAEFGDTIYPGLVPTGRVSRGKDKPWHTVINGENFHVLKALSWTHRGKVDAIYIDPPYNTGAKDWKYNNDYVESDDNYRHSKWLAMIERRLLVAEELLNPSDSVLIVTIDEKEYLRLGLLLEQIFPQARITMVSTSINSAGATRRGTFSRAAEYLFFVQFGTSRPVPLKLGEEWNPVKTDNKKDIYWSRLIRSGADAARADSPNQFYPVFVRNTGDGPVFEKIGDPYYSAERTEIVAPTGTEVIWPIRQDGSEGRWRVSSAVLRNLLKSGYARLGRWRGKKTTIYYLKQGEKQKVQEGAFPVVGYRADGSVITDSSDYETRLIPTEIWRITSHDAGNSGSRLIDKIIPKRKFPFPKSLYAVEDALRFFLINKPDAIVLDFFSGSGTTAHATMRLNREDGGKRQCICVTNNEVGADEQKALRKQSLRPGDREWEDLGICDFITKPRVRSAITGKTPDGRPIKGVYKFNEKFPMADGLEENAEFFTLTYETPLAVSYQTAFARIAPLIWLRAGSIGRRIDKPPANGWEVADTYSLLVDLDQATEFLKVVRKAKRLRISYIVTDDERRFQALARRLPKGVEAVRLYESYLTNFAFANGERR